MFNLQFQRITKASTLNLPKNGKSSYAIVRPLKEKDLLTQHDEEIVMNESKDPNYLEFKSNQGTGFIILGTIAFIILLIGKNLLSFGGLGLIGIGIWHIKNRLIVIDKDNMEMKIAPLRSRQIIRYSNITKMEVISPKKVLLLVKENGGEKKIKLPMSFIKTDERELLINELRRRIDT